MFKEAYTESALFELPCLLYFFTTPVWAPIVIQIILLLEPGPFIKKLQPVGKPCDINELYIFRKIVKP